MEEERLYDAKIAFEEDTKRFQDYMEHVEQKCYDAEKERILANRINDKKTDKINQLNSNIAKVNNNIQSIND